MKEKYTKGEIKMEDIHKEIDLIQACITRMADNSFRLKELYVSLISIAITVMLSQACDWLIVGLFLLGVTTVFWGLDAFFLKWKHYIDGNMTGLLKRGLLENRIIYII